MESTQIMGRYAYIDVEANLRTNFSCAGGLNVIEIRATSVGLTTSNVVSVQVSKDHEKDGVLPTASRSVVF